MHWRKLKLWKILVGSCVSVLILPFIGAAAEVSVEITDSGRHQINIAIPAFVSETGAADSTAETMAAVLRNDLQLSGFFDTMKAQEGTIEGLHHADVKGGLIQFQQWADTGARLLVKGKYRTAGDSVQLEARVYDTLGGDFILGKRYESRLNQKREVIHRFADEIILKMTGKPGMSTTKIVFVADRNGAKELYQIDFDGANLVQLTQDRSLVLSPAVSPDGTKVCYTSYKDNNPDLYAMTLDDRQIDRIAMFAGLNFSADWAPDNRTLAVTLSKDGNPELYTLDSVTQKVQRITRNRWNDVSPAWSPDGMEIAYTADKIGAPQLYIIERTGGNLRRLTFRGSYNVSPAWSPTGDLIAFSSSMDGNFNIYTVQPDGENLRQLTQNAGNNEDPAWSPDGRYLTFQSTRGGTTSIYIMNADGANQRRLTDNQGHDLSPAWRR